MSNRFASADSLACALRAFCRNVGRLNKLISSGKVLFQHHQERRGHRENYGTYENTEHSKYLQAAYQGKKDEQHVKMDALAENNRPDKVIDCSNDNSAQGEQNNAFS